MAGGYLPLYLPGDTVPVTVGSGGIVEGHLITTTGVECADAEVKVAGVAGFTAAQGAVVTVFREGLHTGVASAAIANGASICCAASGKLRTWVAGTDAVASRIGRAWSAAAGNNSTFSYSLIGV